VVDGPASQSEEDRLRYVFGVSHTSSYAVRGFEDTRLVGTKDFLKLSGCFCHHDGFYRGRQVSLLGSSTT